MNIDTTNRNMFIRLSFVLLLFVFCSSFSFAAILDNLTFSYNVDESSGTQVGSNISPSTNNLTTSATIVTGKIGSARNVSGSSQSLSKTTSNLGINNTQDMTINFWYLRNSDIASGTAYLFQKRSDNGVGSVNYYIAYEYNGGNRRLYFARSKDGVGEASFTIPYNLSTNWNMITLRYNGTNLSGFINVNSTNSVATDTISGNIVNTRGMWFGSTSNVADPAGNGTYDIISGWNRTLSISEITELYNGGSGLQYPFSTFVSNFSISAARRYDASAVQNFSVILKQTQYTFGNNFWTGFQIPTGNPATIDTYINFNGTAGVPVNFSVYRENISLDFDELVVNATYNGQINYSVFIDGTRVGGFNDLSLGTLTSSTTMNLNQNRTIGNLSIICYNLITIPCQGFITSMLFRNGSTFSSYSTTNYTIDTILPASNPSIAEINFSATNYLPRSFNATGVTGSFIGNLSQTNLTFYFYDSLTGNLINSSANWTNTVYSKTHAVVNGTVNIDPPAGNNSFVYTTGGYGNATSSYSFSALLYANYSVFVFPVLNFTFYDEATNGPLNMSRLSSLLFYTLCANQSTFVNVTTTSVISAPSCNVTSFQAFASYPGQTVYMRSFLPFDLVSNGSGFNRIYMIDLNTTTGVYQTFSIDDLFSQYNDPALVIYKVIGNATYQIHGAEFDAEQKVGATLIFSNLYTMTLKSSNKPDRVIGSYVADSAGDKSLRVYDVSLGGGQESSFANVSFSRGIINISNSQFYYANYTDPTGLTTSVSYQLLANGSTQALDGTVISSSVFTTTSFSILENISGYNSSTIYDSFNIQYNGNTLLIGGLMKAPSMSSRPSLFDTIDQSIINWFVLIALSVIGLYATSRSHDITAVFITLGAFILSLMNWITFGAPLYWGVMGAVGVQSFIGILVMISLINLFRTKADRVNY